MYVYIATANKQSLFHLQALDLMNKTFQVQTVTELKFMATKLFPPVACWYAALLAFFFRAKCIDFTWCRAAVQILHCHTGLIMHLPDTSIQAQQARLGSLHS